MRVVSINVGTARTIRQGRREWLTGIDKQPVPAAVQVTAGGLIVAGQFNGPGGEGHGADVVVDQEHHGGRDQAVYVYGADDYAWWRRELGRDLRYGTFGDNLTIAGFPPDLNAGDRLLVGDVILEATAPRIPCSTLAAQMQDSDFGLRFRNAERPGTYFRVLHDGEIAPQDPVTLVENPGPSVSMLELFRAWYELAPRAALLQRIVAAPVAERARLRFQARLDALAD